MILLSYIIIFSNKSRNKDDLFESLFNTIQSVARQTLNFWDLNIYCDRSDYLKILSLVKKLPNDKSLLKNIQIRPIDTVNHSAILNHAISSVAGRWLTVIPMGDQISPYSTYLLLHEALSHEDRVLVYADQNFITNNKLKSDTFYRPNFSIDLLYSKNYIGDFFIFKKDAVIKIGGFDESLIFNWSHDLILRLLNRFYLSRPPNNSPIENEETKINDIFSHIPFVIHHQHSLNSSELLGIDTNFSRDNIKKSKEGLISLKKHFTRIGIKVVVKKVKPFVYRHKWPVFPGFLR